MSIKPTIRAVLEGDDACASALVKATFDQYGNHCLAWEPETLRLEFIEDGLDVPRQNFDALMAAFTLIQTDAFFWDHRVFAQTCLAFNQLPCDPELTPELTPAQISWALDEAEVLCPEKGTVFDTSPTVYAAVSLQNMGMVWAPGNLGFLNEILEELVECDAELISEVKKRWAEIVSTDLREFAPPEDAVGVQLALCAATTLYRQDLAAARVTQLGLLQDS